MLAEFQVKKRDTLGARYEDWRPGRYRIKGPAFGFVVSQVRESELRQPSTLPSLYAFVICNPRLILEYAVGLPQGHRYFGLDRI